VGKFYDFMEELIVWKEDKVITFEEASEPEIAWKIVWADVRPIVLYRGVRDEFFKMEQFEAAVSDL
jgi:hypothetical protein